MKIRIMIAILVVAIVLGGIFLFYEHVAAPTVPAAGTVSDYKNATYSVDGSDVLLINGYAESEIAPGSASKLVTQYFGDEAAGDLTGDGISDEAFILTQSGGGSGTFYYVVAAIAVSGGYRGTNAILLGDRIAPQTTEIKDGKVTVNYADRAPNEPMAAQPSVGVSRYFRVQDGMLVEVKG